MTNRRNRHPARRRFLKQAAAITITRIGPATALAVPAFALGQSAARAEENPPAVVSPTTAATGADAGDQTAATAGETTRSAGETNRSRARRQR